MKEKKLYFKVNLGYEKSIQISGDLELSKAIYAKAYGKTIILKSALVDGKYISEIELDTHRIMGFNDGYKIQPEDRPYIARECKDYDGYIEKVSKEVKQMVESGQIQQFFAKEQDNLLE